MSTAEYRHEPTFDLGGVTLPFLDRRFGMCECGHSGQWHDRGKPGPTFNYTGPCLISLCACKHYAYAEVTVGYVIGPQSGRSQEDSHIEWRPARTPPPLPFDFDEDQPTAGVVTWWQKGQQQPGWHYLCRDCGLTGYSAEPSPEAHMAWCPQSGRGGDQ